MSDYFVKKKEESDKRIQEALEERKKRKETEENSLASKKKESDNKIEEALAERSERVQSSLPSVFSEIESLLTVELDHYNSTKPSYGDYDSVYESQKERRKSISNLRSKVNAYRNYMNAEAADKILSLIDQIESGYDAYLARSGYASEDAYKESLASQKAYEDQLNFDLEAGSQEITSLERALKEYDTLTRFEHGEEGVKRLEELRNEYGSVSDLEDLISEKKKYLKNAKLAQSAAKLADVVNESDFDTYKGYVSTELDGLWDKMNSQYGMGYGDLKYEYINGAENGMRSEISRKASVWRSDAADDWEIYEYMNPDEISIYNYYYSKDGKKAAEKYLDSINSTLESRSNSALVKGAAEFSSDHEIIASLFSIACSLASGSEYLEDVADYGVEIIKGNEYARIGYNESSLASSTIRGTVAEQVDWMIGNWDAFDFLYNTTMSGVDSITAGTLFGPYGGIVLGLSAAAQGTNDALNRGMSSSQAFWSGLFSGVFECVFETISLGQFKALKEIAPKSIKDIFKNLGKSMLVNASEEALTEIANIGYDTLVNGEFANYTLEDLKNGAWKDALWQVLESGASGALMGMGMSSFASTSAYAKQQSQYYKTGKSIKAADGGLEALKKLANDVSGVTSADMQNALNEHIDKVNNKATNKRVGKLYNAVQEANNQANASANQADIAKSLTRKGINGVTANAIADALVARYNGRELTNEQSKLLKSVKDSQVVQDAVSNIMDNTKSTMGQRNQNIRDFQSGVYKGLINNEVKKIVRQNTTAKQFTPTGEYEVSDNGKAINTETGEEIEVKGVSYISNGKMLLDIGDGKTVNAKSVSFASDSDALIYESIAKLGDNISFKEANKLIDKYDGSNAAVFARGIAQAYTYGFYGIDSSELAGKHSLATELTTEQRNYAYGLGEQYRSVKDQANKALARARKAPGEKGVYYRDKNGNATDIRSYLEQDGRVLNEMQTTGIEFMEKMSKTMGVRFNVFETWEKNGKKYYLDEDGVVQEGNPNGFYDRRTGEIYIDLFAGNDFQGTMLFTVAHELTHFMRQWSPEHFTKISKLVFSHAGFKGSVSSLVADKMNTKRKLSYDAALEEVVADGMETILKDGKVAEFMADVKKTDSKVWAKLKEWFQNFAEFLKKMVNAYSGQSAQTVEGQKVADFSKKLLNQIEQIWAEGAVSAGENYQAALENVVEENAEAVSSDEIITDGAVVTDGEGTKFSIKSMKHDIAEGQMFEDLKTYCGWTQQQVNELRQNLENLVEYMTPNRGILDMNETYGMEGRRFSPYKPNSDPLYKISMDFSTLCSKRLLTQYVIENLQIRENRPMSAEEQMAIRDMLNEYRKVEKGLQVACAMCYVEAARLKSPKQIQRWLDDPAPLLRNYFGKKNKEFNDSVKKAQADFKESRGYARNAPKKDMKNADRKELDKIGPKLRSQYQLSAEEQAIVEKAKTLPNSTYLTAGNLSDLSETDPVIYDAYTTFVRNATRSKSLETDEPYYYGDSRRDNGNGIIVSDSFIEAVNRENGMRFSSWSDWRIQHLLDYITAVIDNSVRGAAMHGYTKFGDEVRVLGKTGMMFNMSGVAGTQTGLNEDGSLNFSPTESIDVNEAVQLRDEFPETAGLQCIGVSDAHIIELLRSDIIDYVIPYHISGLNAALRRMADIYGWADYTGTQHATIDKSIKKENAADPEHWHEEPVFSEFFVGYDTGMSGIEAMRASAEQYKQMCKDRGMTPKFNQFANEDNYWKLLIDRKMINQQTGDLIRQKAVTPTFDFNTIKGVVDRYVDNYDSGLEARALNHIVENWDSIPKRIKDLKKQGGTKAKKTKKAIGTLANQTLAAQSATNQDTKFSMREIVGPSGKNYGVGVYLDSTLLENLSEDERISMVKEYIKEIGGSTFTAYDNSHKAVDILLVESSRKFKNKSGKNVPVLKDMTNYLKNDVKQEAIALVDELILASTYRGAEPATHPHDWVDNNGANDWDVWTTYIQDKKNTVWEAKLRIANSANGEKILYDIFPINKVEEAQTMGTATTNGIISQSDPGVNTEALHSDRDTAPTFYSQMAKVVDAVKQEKLGAASVVSMLRGKGVKAEEIKWSGIETWLEGKKSVTKAELQEFIAGSMLQIEEATLDGKHQAKVEVKKLSKKEYALFVDGKQVDTLNKVKGGLFSAVIESSNTNQAFNSMDDAVNYYKRKNRNRPRHSAFTLDGGTNYRELLFKLPGSEYSNNAMQIHWGKDAHGILAHARMQDMNTFIGKMLFIEEIQSDWHNEGHKTGYQDVPDAPFSDNYHEYVMKRLLREAAEQDYDSIGWTTADVQMDRWNHDRRTNAEFGFKDARNPNAIAFEEGYRIEYDQDIPKFLNKYGKKWGTKVGKTVLDNGTEVWSMAITDSMKESVMTEGQALYSDRDTAALDMFGTTTNFEQAGFVLADGKMLKLSQYGLKGVKHQLIEQVYDDAKGSDAVNRFIQEGHVRLKATSPGIEIGAEIAPTTNQLNVISRFVSDSLRKRGTFYLDITGKSGDVIASVAYDEWSSAEDIIYDIKDYYNRGKVPTERNVFFQDRSEDSVSNRSLLANAFEGIAKPEEMKLVAEYKSNLEKANDAQARLNALNAKIKELSFSKGPRDTNKINELRKTAKDVADLVSKYDKKLLKIEAAQPLQDVIAREKKIAYAKAAQRGRESLAEYKAKVEAQQKETTEKWRESRKAAVAKARETAEKRDARDKLQKLVLDTAKWISYPAKTDVKCPDILKKPYEAFLQGIDLSSKRLANGGEATKNDLRLANAMDSLATALDKIITAQNPTTDPNKVDSTVLDAGYLDLPTDFVKQLRDMTEKIKDMMVEGEYVINNMTAAEVRKLSQLIRTLNHAIKTMSKLYANLRFANVEALGFDTMDFLDALGEIEKTGGMKDFTQWDNALPYYAFKRFGKGGESIFEGLMDAQDKLAFLAQDIFDFQEKTWTGKEAKAWSKDAHTIDLPNGNELTLTTADAMSIYCLSRREHALPHLLGGGIRVMGIHKGSKKAKDSRSLLTIQDVDAIISSLTDRQKQVADGIQEFMSTVCSEWGNEISMKRFLTREFNEKFYFPIESNDENLTARDPAAQQSDLFRLLNISATKPLTQGANNELIIRNIFDVFVGHASDMARLNAYGLGLLDYMKWLNYRERGVNEVGQINVKGVRKSMETAYGNAANSYVLNLVKDVNGRASDGGDPTILMKWMRAAKTAAVGNSLRVATLQVTAYPRAAMVLSPKSLALGLTKLPKIEMAKKYCGIALWKSFGFYDTNISRSIEDQMKGVTDIKQKLIELSLKGAEWGDAITWGALWNACEYEVAKTTTYKVGSEEFRQEVGKKLREVVYRTQVVDSTLTRSQIMRSKRGMAQEAAAFMSEPTLSANILMDAGFEFGLEKRRTGSAKTAWKKTGSYIATAVAVYSIGQLTAALVEGLWDAWRDDDDEEFWEKYLSAFGENFALDLVPFNKIPIVSDVFEGALAMFGVGFYSSDKMSTAWLTQAVSAVDAWKDVLGGSSSTTTYNALYKTVRAVSSYYGVAFSGLMREGVALWNNTAGAYDTTLKIRQYDLSKTDLGTELYDAIISGDANQADSLKAQFEDQDALSSAIRTALRENDPRIKEAAEAQIEGNPSERVRISRLIIADGFSQDDVVQAINAEINDMTPSGPESAPKKKGFYTAEDFAIKIANGDKASAAAAKEDIIQTAQSNGKDEDTAEQSFINSAKTKLKEQYVAGNLSESQAVDALKTYCQDDDDPMDDNDIYWLLKEWKYEKETGSADGYGKYNDFHNSVKTGKNLKAVIADYTGHGVTAKTLASQITTYFKPLYKNMSNYERANLKGYLLNAYTILGYNRNEKSKDIDKWLED